MAQPTISYDGRIIYELPPTRAPESESVLWFTARKGGTTLLSKLIGGLSGNLENVFIRGRMYQLGFRPGDEPDEISGIFLEQGYCYGFAGFPRHDIPILSRAKSILLVRDPRDMLVSRYFHIRSSHPPPGTAPDRIANGYTEIPERALTRSATLDEYALLLAAEVGEELMTLCQKVPEETRRLYHYEDVVYDKRAWAEDICDHFGWRVPEKRLQRAINAVDVFPNSEQPSAHIRQVHPGNFRKKLRQETIDRLNDELSSVLVELGYAS